MGIIRNGIFTQKGREKRELAKRHQSLYRQEERKERRKERAELRVIEQEEYRKQKRLRQIAEAKARGRRRAQPSNIKFGNIIKSGQKTVKKYNPYRKKKTYAKRKYKPKKKRKSSKRRKKSRKMTKKEFFGI
ncbi:MAG: hypothetical protein ACFFDN_02605 [Candidatus Hodarchaeota archaeon]